MSFSINTGAMTTNLNSNISSQAISSSLNRLSTASQINSAADNASGMTIADQLSAQARGMGQSIMNANDSIGMIQIADSTMQGVSDNMDKIRELTIRASSGIMNNANRIAIQKEIDALMQSSNDTISRSNYNGINLFAGNTTVSDKAQGFSLDGTIDVTSKDGLTSALDMIGAMKTSINEVRSDMGSRQNQLSSEIRNMSIGQVNTAAAQSQIRDVDFAAESANFTQANLKSQIGSFAQAHSNALASNITKLFA